MDIQKQVDLCINNMLSAFIDDSIDLLAIRCHNDIYEYAKKHESERLKIIPSEFIEEGDLYLSSYYEALRQEEYYKYLRKRKTTGE